LLVDELEGVRVVLGRGDHEGMRGRSQARVEGVQLEPGGAAAGGAEVAEDLVLDAFEDEARPRVAAGGGPAVVRRAVEALGDEADAGQRIRRAALPPPHPAVLPGGAVIVL